MASISTASYSTRNDSAIPAAKALSQEHEIINPLEYYHPMTKYHTFSYIIIFNCTCVLLYHDNNNLLTVGYSVTKGCIRTYDNYPYDTYVKLRSMYMYI